MRIRQCAHRAADSFWIRFQLEPASAIASSDFHLQTPLHRGELKGAEGTTEGPRAGESGFECFVDVDLCGAGVAGAGCAGGLRTLPVDVPGFPRTFDLRRTRARTAQSRSLH